MPEICPTCGANIGLRGWNRIDKENIKCRTCGGQIKVTES